MPGDADARRQVTITLWASAEALVASEEKGRTLLSNAADRTGSKILSIESLEVTALELGP